MGFPKTLCVCGHMSNNHALVCDECWPKWKEAQAKLATSEKEHNEYVAANEELREHCKALKAKLVGEKKARESAEKEVEEYQNLCCGDSNHENCPSLEEVQEKEEIRWQEKIHAITDKEGVDGDGSDGDALEYTCAAINQAIGKWIDKHDEVESKLSAITVKLVEADEGHDQTILERDQLKESISAMAAKLEEAVQIANREKDVRLETEMSVQKNLDRAVSAESKLSEELARVNRLLALPLPEKVERWRKEAAANGARVERLRDCLDYVITAGVKGGRWNTIMERMTQAVAFCDKTNEEILKRGE